MSHENPEPVILDYRKPERESCPSFVLAALLCLPGLLCWLVFCGNSILARYQVPGGDMVPVLWMIAILTAVTSFIWYGITWRKPKPWYVIFCLVANAVGLAFSVLILVS